MSALTCISSRRLSQPSGVSKQLYLELDSVVKAGSATECADDSAFQVQLARATHQSSPHHKPPTDSRVRQIALAAHFAPLRASPRPPSDRLFWCRNHGLNSINSSFIETTFINYTSKTRPVLYCLFSMQLTAPSRQKKSTILSTLYLRHLYDIIYKDVLIHLFIF